MIFTMPAGRTTGRDGKMINWRDELTTELLPQRERQRPAPRPVPGLAEGGLARQNRGHGQ